MKYGNRNFLVPSGPLQACNGTAFYRSHMAVLFITFFPYSSVSILYYCMYSCMFCMLLFNFVNYVFLLLCYVHFCQFKNSYCYVRSVPGIVFHCVVLCIVYM